MHSRIQFDVSADYKINENCCYIKCVWANFFATEMLVIDSSTVIRHRRQSPSVMFIYSKSRLGHLTKSRM